ncbi:MAG: DUF4870 domain-containing protein [Chloroflexi bacterium]|nr:DUF4870 domain-containing protein [Chloroflexota bacterium]
MAEKESSAAVSDNDRTMSLLAYIIGIIVPLLILLSESSKNRPFQRYHAINSLGVWAAALAYWIPFWCCIFLLGYLFPLLGCLFLFLGFLPWIPFIYYGLQAYQGKHFEIPVVTKFMKSQGWL